MNHYKYLFYIFIILINTTSLFSESYIEKYNRARLISDSSYYNIVYNPSKAFQYTLELIELGNDLQNDSILGCAYGNLANLLSNQGALGKALEYNAKAYQYFERTGDYSGCAWILIDIGNYYYDEGDNNKAIPVWKDAYKMSLKAKNKASQKTAGNNIGIGFRSKKMYDSAYYYFHFIKELNKKNNDTLGYIFSLDYEASILFIIGKSKEGLKLCDEAIELLDKRKPKNVNDSTDVYSLYSRIYAKRCASYSALNKLDSAYLAYQTSINYINVLKTELNKMRLLDDISTYFFPKYLDIAIDIQSKALKIADDNNLFSFAKLYCQNLLTYYTYKSNIDSTLYYYQQAANFDKQVDSIDRTSLYDFFKTKIEIERKIDNYEILKRDAEISSLNLQRQTILIIGLLLLILLIAIFTVIYRKKYVAEQNLNILLENTNNKLLESENRLKDLNNTKDKFFSIIAHDLRNPLAAYKNLTEILVSQYNSLEESEKLNLIESMTKSAKNLFQLLNNLLEWSGTQTGSILFVPNRINLLSLIKSQIYLINIAIAQKGIVLTNNIKDEFTVFADEQMIATVLRNLIENAVKFTNENGEIILNAYKSDNCDIVEVIDNGVGMTQEQVETLFKIQHQQFSKGTHGEKGSGLGLILCKEFIDAHKGKIEVESEKGKGTKFTIKLPH